jgi:hypothetical protein
MGGKSIGRHPMRNEARHCGSIRQYTIGLVFTAGARIGGALPRLSLGLGLLEDY